MTDTGPFSIDQVAEAERRYAAYRHSHEDKPAFACCTAHQAADLVPGLIETIKTLREILERRDTGEEHPISQERLAELTRMDAEATEPPWWLDESDLVWRLHGTAGWSTGYPEDLLPPQPINHQIAKAPKRGTDYMEYWPNEADARFITEGRQGFRDLLMAVRAYRQRVGECVCGDPGEVPYAECLAHGSIPAYHQARARQEEAERLLRRFQEHVTDFLNSPRET